MLTAVEGLIAQLRRVGMPISVSEGIDAVRALEHLDLAQRSEVKVGLRTALVKNADHEPTFNTIFDLYFGLGPLSGNDLGDPGASADGFDASDPGSEFGAGDGDGDGEGDGRGGGGGAGGGLSGVDDRGIRELLIGALRRRDRFLTRAIAGVMVDRHAKFEPGRPVAGTYYQFRTLRAVNLDLVLAALLADAGDETDSLASRLHVERSERQVQEFRDEVASEIRRRLVADRGAEAVAKTLRTPLPEDIGFLTASQAEIVTLRATVEPLTRKLASKLSHRRRHRRKGALDFRRTVRASMSTGGVPAEPVFRKPRPSKPELVVLADISGSVATFAGFTLQFVYALRQEFATVRCFVFVDGVDEVTDLIAESRDIAEVTSRINQEGRGVWLDGRSDYGHALEAFWEGWGRTLSRRSTVVVLGDARTNYQPPRDHVLAAVRKQTARLFWLNPETAVAWDSGDSVIGQYAPHCDAVFECRNVRQLKAFVDHLD
jgi:uncharacterized protein with von Willebrand factor type A (vWA) domain